MWISNFIDILGFIFTVVNAIFGVIGLYILLAVLGFVFTYGLYSISKIAL